MAQTLDINSIHQSNSENTDFIHLESDSSGKINLPEGHFIGDSEISRDGQDLVLQFTEGDNFTVDSYFLNSEDVLIEDSAGSVLSEGLINSFMHSSPEYAQAHSMTDESPVGAVEELKGDATITHADGSVEPVTLGTPIYQGDIIQTSDDGAVNIMFIDETSMAISENARMAIDNYKFDAATESGETNFSVLRGVFVYTSGLIGRDDPDDVEIDTPVGSIGIRGTIIAGNINPEGQSEISVLEGAIVVTNGAGERTLSEQYETVKLSSFQEEMDYKGVQAANDIGKTYGSVKDVLPKLFSSINDAAKEEIKTQEEKQEDQNEVETIEEEETEEVLEKQVDETVEAQDPTMEVMQDFLGINAVQHQQMQTDGSPKNSPSGFNAVDPIGAITPHHFNEEILYQEAKIFTEDPNINVHFNHLFEHAEAGTVVGVVIIQGYPATTNITFTAGSTTSTAYTINQVGNTNKFEITLNNPAPAFTPGGSIPLDPLFVTLPDSTEIPLNIGHVPYVLDAAVNVNSPNGLDYEIGNGVYLSPTNSGDFDGDGNIDQATMSGGEINVTTGHATSTGGNTYSSGHFVGDINNDGKEDIVGIVSGSAGIDIITNNGASTTETSRLAGHSLNISSVDNAGNFDGIAQSDFVLGDQSANTTNGVVIVGYGDNDDYLKIDGTGGEGLGKSVHGIGDFNGDGISDIMATNTQNGAYIIFGGADLTNAGTIDSINTTNLNGGARGFTISDGALTNLVASGSAGDINGDGFDDFALSFQDSGNVNTYVVYGNDGVSANLNLATLENPEHALKIHESGVTASNYTITALGDVDGDGFDDLQVGNASGTQYVIHGQTEIGSDVVIDGSANDAAGTVGDPDGFITASANNQSLAGDVDFNDGGKTDLRMTGGGDNNTFEINNDEFKRIDGGKGTLDTIQFGQNGGTLDFTNIDFEQIQQIEQIKFGSTGQTITLTAENIFNMLKSSDNGELRITGIGSLYINDGTGTTSTTVEGALNEQGSGANLISGVATENGTDYTHYQIGGYDLYIDAEITTTVV